jgi:hypothetical protein
MFEHLVVFKLKPSVTVEQQQSLVDKLLSFKGQIDGLIEVTAGINITEEMDNRHGFNLGLRVTFQDAQALRAYGPHPVHQAFVRMLDGILEQVVVVDYPHTLD